MLVAAAPKKTIIETGEEPDYFITDIAKAESLPGGNIRLYMASEVCGELRVRYTVVVSQTIIAALARQAMALAADAHNLDTISSLLPGILH